MVSVLVPCTGHPHEAVARELASGQIPAGRRNDHHQHHDDAQQARSGTSEIPTRRHPRPGKSDVI